MEITDAWFPGDTRSLQSYIDGNTPEKDSKYIHYYCGVDLGKKRDPSTVVVIRTYYAYGKVEYQVGYLRRFSLSMLYTDISTKLATLDRQLKALAAKEGKEAIVTYVCDATGIGGPILEVVSKKLPYARIMKAYITGGINTTYAPEDPWEFHIPKGQLVSGLMAAYDRGIMSMPRDSKEADAILDELANFEIHISEAGHDSYYAAPSKHDDLVVALALAVWACDMDGDSSGPMVW
jgi:hypothetical protein